jgi:hypothetical protein
MPPADETPKRAELLVQAGLSPDYVAKVLGVAVQSKAIIATRSLSKEDEDLAKKLRGLIDFAIDEARHEILFGAPQDRVGLIKVLVARGSQMFGTESSTRIDELREMFLTEMEGTRRLEDPELEEQ